MKISVTFLDNPSAKGSLRVDKKLASGKFEVFQAYSADRKINYALKAFPKTHNGLTQYKREQIMSSLSHPHVIKQIPISCHHEKFKFNLMELAKYGDFFDLANDGLFQDNEILIRTYFHQLVEGLEYIHSQGIAHLDLKLENLMLGSEFMLKIIDFDQSQPIKDNYVLSRGTENYRAPEVRNNTCKDFVAADVYSIGIILYVLQALEFPFLEDKKEDPKNITSRSYFMDNNQAFWEMKIKKRGEKNPFSPEFIELVNGMLHTESNRFTLEDIKTSKWYNGPTLDSKSLKTEVKSRWDLIMRERERSIENCYAN